jgi:opacity protein-like surface antigen
MKRIIVCISALLTLISLSSVAAAQEPRYNVYVGALGGGVFPMDLDIRDKADEVIVADQDLENGYLVGAKIGYLWPGKMFGLEVEYNYIDGTNGKSQYAYTYAGTPLSLEGDITINAWFLNFLLRYPDGNFHPYLGVGAGWLWFDCENIRGSADLGGGLNVRTERINESDNCVVYQVLLGLEVDIAPDTSLLLGYKYLQSEPELSQLGAEIKYRANIVTLGLNYMFY